MVSSLCSEVAACQALFSVTVTWHLGIQAPLANGVRQLRGVPWAVATKTRPPEIKTRALVIYKSSPLGDTGTLG